MWLQALAPELSLRLARPTPAELGPLGERLAARSLRRAGWRILGKRVRTASLEVDLVARRGSEIACVEVKCGWIPRLEGTGEPDLRWRPAARVDRERQVRLAAAARAFARRAGRARAVALVVEVRLDPGGLPAEVRIDPIP